MECTLHHNNYYALKFLAKNFKNVELMLSHGIGCRKELRISTSHENFLFYLYHGAKLNFELSVNAKATTLRN